MINIRETLLDVQSLSDYLAEQRTEQLDEGLKDIINTLKRKFKQVVNYLSGLVAKLTGSSWLPVDDNGTVLPASSPLTAGQAYADGVINKASTVVVMTGPGKRVTGCPGKLSDCKALYGPGNSIDYWRRGLNESLSKSGKTINCVSD